MPSLLHTPSNPHERVRRSEPSPAIHRRVNESGAPAQQNPNGGEAGGVRGDSVEKTRAHLQETTIQTSWVARSYRNGAGHAGERWSRHTSSAAKHQRKKNPSAKQPPPSAPTSAHLNSNLSPFPMPIPSPAAPTATGRACPVGGRRT